VVFTGAFGTLAIMTILSTIFGAVITSFVSKTITHLIVADLFFFFGGELFYEAYH
jgi:putative Ca2+/H+ antiporter (TMEM165/GDT1 family)